jgi:hypothetical protein
MGIEELGAFFYAGKRAESETSGDPPAGPFILHPHDDQPA